MNKKQETIIAQDMASGHPLSPEAFTNNEPMKCTSILVIPLLDEQMGLPYFDMPLELQSEYQREAIQMAMRQGEPVFLVPEAEFGADMPDDHLIASRFKGTKGVIAYPVNFEAPKEANGMEYGRTLLKGGFQGEVFATSWISDFVGVSVHECDYRPIPNPVLAEQYLDLLDISFEKLMSFLPEHVRTEIHNGLDALPSRSLASISFMMFHSPLDYKEKLSILAELDMPKRMELILHLFSEHIQKLKIREEINMRTMEQFNERQKTDYLRTQIKTIQRELNIEVDENDDEELRQRADAKNWTEETRDAFDKEMRKLLRYASNSPEYAMQYSYLDTFLNLPWLDCDSSDFDLKDVERILNRDHYALDKVKDRIIEQMAVLKLRQDTKAPILCLVGPPGVGKTSLGKSVAEALGRKYVRVALGGVHDEAEIRGHRRTYLGAMCGRIIAALEKCGTSDPVMVLDEIDKLGADYKGDPQTALLEVLDPEQNSHFHDNYIDHDYDLSKILFIATANSLDTISAPLLDRMEVIDIGGYVEDEKIEIATRHLVPLTLERHGFGRKEIRFTREGLHEIIECYTRESGVRQLEKKIAEVLRKLARRKVMGEDYPRVISDTEVRELLGKRTIFPDKYENNDIAGVVTGLAWTQSGGDILFIESSVSPSKEAKLTLTGNLGDVMKESAILATQYLKANSTRFGIDPQVFDNKALHIHVPEGAIPKDGPSAGITMLTSIASAYTNRKVRQKLAMTGELTLRGKVLPVGGIKEKMLAAKRAGITDVMLCSQNQKDIEEIPSQYLEGMTFHYVDSAAEVLDFALLDELATC